MQWSAVSQKRWSWRQADKQQERATRRREETTKTRDKGLLRCWSSTPLQCKLNRSHCHVYLWIVTKCVPVSVQLSHIYSYTEPFPYIVIASFNILRIIIFLQDVKYKAASWLCSLYILGQFKGNITYFVTLVLFLGDISPTPHSWFFDVDLILWPCYGWW